MALTVNAITDRAAGILNDVGSIRYTVADLVKYISDGQRRTVIMRPDLASTMTRRTLVAGIRQTLEAGALRLVDVTRNVTTGNVFGRALRRIDRAVMDQEDPNWPRHPAAAQADHWMYEPEKEATTFYVYPAPSKVGTQQVEMRVVFDPPEVIVGGTLSIDPMFHEPLIDYVVARAASRDAEFGDQLNRAQVHAQAWASAIGVDKNASL